MGEPEGETPSSRANVLSLIDGFLEQLQKLRKIMLGMSLSAIMLAPLAIALSAYLIFHPSFFAILEIENEFGLVLGILLAAVIIISGIWLGTGVKQYRSMSTWQQRYEEYMKEKAEIDKRIASQFGLDQQE